MKINFKNVSSSKNNTNKLKWQTFEHKIPISTGNTEQPGAKHGVKADHESSSLLCWTGYLYDAVSGEALWPDEIFRTTRDKYIILSALTENFKGQNFILPNNFDLFFHGTEP